jgi:GLPGLI family protein
MNKTFIIINLLLTFISIGLSAQNVRFTADGVIEFEKSTNMYAILQRRLGKNPEGYMTQIFDQYKKTQPQFRLSKSLLYFSKTKTLFKPDGTETPVPFFGESASVSQINIIYKDLAANQQITQKKVFEQTFLLKDSIRAINWKITSETREIAGYTCRRANALVMDSIYVVAFYTDQIPVSSGPESFNGLPGMILGVAIPHENLSWFAKKVTDKPIETNVVVPPVKGKTTDNKGLLSTLQDALKNWGDYAKAEIKAYLL